MDEIGIRVVRRPWNKGNLLVRRAVQTQRNLGYSGQASNLLPNTRIGAVRSWHRQQTARLRSAKAEDSRRLSRRARRSTGDRAATRNIETRAVRNYRANPTALADCTRLSGLSFDNFLSKPCP